MESTRPAREGEEIFARAWFTALDDRPGKRSGRLLIEHGRTEYRNADGELLAVNLSRQLRKPRPAAGSGDALRVAPIEPYRLTDDQLTALEDELLAYRRRGAEPRYWDDVTVGDKLDARIKGPLQLIDMIAFTIGIGSVMSGEMELRRRRAVAADPESAPNHRSTGWQLERTPPGAGHMDPTVARAVGMPGVYDNGWLRVCWMGQIVTDWMGDAGKIRVLDTRLRLPNIVGDVLRIDGEVVAKRRDDQEALVVLKFQAARQDGEASCLAEATVALPVRTQVGTSRGDQGCDPTGIRPRQHPDGLRAQFRSGR